MLGLGTDVVDVERFRVALNRTPRIVGRLFTDAEQSYARQLRDPTERLAVRFAAKEATMKALGVGLGAFAFRDVEVRNAESGEPSLSLTGGARDLADGRGVRLWRVSVTHSHAVALAVVIAL